MKRAEGAANGEDWIAAIAALAATLQFVALFWTIYILRRNTRIAERAYISGGGYFPNDPCPFRKSYPDVVVVQPGQDRDGDNGTGALDRPTQGRVFAQR